MIRPTWVPATIAALCVAAAVHFSEMLLPHLLYFDGEWAIWWPVNGIALGMLLLARRRHWPWILAGFALGTVITELPTDTVVEMFFVTAANFVEVLIPALVVPRFRTQEKWLQRDRLATRFVVSALIVGPVIGSLLIAVYYHWVVGRPYWAIALRWGSADTLGVALCTPLFLVAISKETWALFRPRQLLPSVGLLTLMAVIEWAVFNQTSYSISFILYPLLLLAASQLGFSGAVIGMNMLAFIGTRATLQDLGPFSLVAGQNELTRLAILQLYLALSIFIALPISVARVRRLATKAQLDKAWLRLEAQATADGLTGVANRRRFDIVLDIEWRRAIREDSSIALLMVDVDRFKAYNDSYGHPSGDSCLRLIAGAIAHIAARPTDLVARYGGEEFAVLLPGTKLQGAVALAERIRSAVHDLELPHPHGIGGWVSVSVGCTAFVPNDLLHPESLVEAADRALYAAKRGGRDRVHTAARQSPQAHFVRY